MKDTGDLFSKICDMDTKVRGVDFVGYRFFGEYTLLRKSTCKTFKRRMLSISSKRENNVSPTYSEWCSFNSYVSTRPLHPFGAAAFGIIHRMNDRNNFL